MEEIQKTGSLPLNLARLIKILEDLRKKKSKNSLVCLWSGLRDLRKKKPKNPEKNDVAFRQIDKAIKLSNEISSSDEADIIKLAKMLVVLKWLIANLNAFNPIQPDKRQSANGFNFTQSLIDELKDYLINQRLLELESDEIDGLINTWIVLLYENYDGNKEDYYQRIVEYQAKIVKENFSIPISSNLPRIPVSVFFNSNRNEPETTDPWLEKIIDRLSNEIVAGRKYFHLFRLKYLLYLFENKGLINGDNFPTLLKHDEQAGGAPEQENHPHNIQKKISVAESLEGWLRKRFFLELKKLAEIQLAIEPNENDSLEKLLQDARECVKGFKLPENFSDYRNTDFLYEGFPGPHRYPMIAPNDFKEFGINANYDQEQSLICSVAPWLSDVNFENYVKTRNIGLVISIHDNEIDDSERRQEFYQRCKGLNLPVAQLVWPDNAALSLDLQNADTFYSIYQQYSRFKNQGKTTYIHCTSGVGRTGVVGWMFRCLNALEINREFNQALTKLVLNQDASDTNIDLVANLVIDKLSEQRLLRYSVHSEEQRDEFFPNFVLLSMVYIRLNHHASLTAHDLAALDKLQAKFMQTSSALKVIMTGENIVEAKNTVTLTSVL